MLNSCIYVQHANMYLGATEGTKPFLSPTRSYINNVKVNSQMAPGITLVSAENLESWVMDIQILDDNPIYQGKTYRLQLNFTSNYPIGNSHLYLSSWPVVALVSLY